jgi:hypothetical protein
MARTVSRTKKTNPYESTGITEVREEGAEPSWLAEVEAELTCLLGTVLRRGGSIVANTWTFRPGGRQRRHE